VKIRSFKVLDYILNRLSDFFSEQQSLKCVDFKAAVSILLCNSLGLAIDVPSHRWVNRTTM